MRLKYKIFIGLYGSMFLLFGIGMTYSVFSSSSTLASSNQNIAKFIFNNEGLDSLEIPLIDLTPGEIKEYPFKISNTSLQKVSNVSVEYQLSLKTYRFIPLEIKLYLIEDGNEILVLNCNETTYTRNIEGGTNELICNTPARPLEHSVEGTDDYKLVVNFESGFNSDIYSNLVDYIKIDINSWQKIAGD